MRDNRALMRFRPEPSFSPTAQAGDGAGGDASERTGVLLVNLGTPDAATPAAVRRFLAEFLSDPRVVELPAVLWQPLLHGVVLRTRPAQSAAKYRQIWTPEGSPLALWTAKQAALLRGWLGERRHRVAVRHAMRYGQPSIASQLDALKAKRCTRILIVPLYPQYSCTTTASVMDAVGAWARQQRRVPALRYVGDFHDDPAYIRALARRVMGHWQNEGQPDQLVMSFHGVPLRTQQAGDPYVAQCMTTARRLAERLALRPAQVQVTFQSRFGKAKWVGPATLETVQALARQGTARVDVICPSFVSDCLETLEEIAIETRDAFLAAGGQAFHYIPALNDSAHWITALSEIVQDHLQGWPTGVSPSPAEAAAVAASRPAALTGRR